MAIVNGTSGTRVDEIGADLYRISTPLPGVPGGFTFNQFLLVDDEPLLFHTGPRIFFPFIREGIEHVMPVTKLRWVGFGHVESDECGAFAEIMAAAPEARLLCGAIQSMLAAHDLTDRPAKVLSTGEEHSLGKHSVRWIDVPHVPHGWDNGFLFESTSRTLFAGDLFTQPGADPTPVTDSDSQILEPSEAMRGGMDYYAHAPQTAAVLNQLAALEPSLLACMHGSSYRGPGAPLLRALADRI